MINKKIIHEFNYNNKKIKIETGLICRNSSSSVFISINDTKVIISILEIEKKKNNDFFPLTVNYYERSYSLGKFPNNALNREIRQNENEILISRLIDRSIRPSLTNITNYNNELYITVIALSMEEDVNPDIISIIGVSSALSILINNFDPIFCIRLSIDKNNKFIINPNISLYEKNDLNIIISGNENSITMIESKSNLIDYNIILDSIDFSINNSKLIIYNIKEFVYKYYKNNNINKKKYNISNIYKDFYLKNIVYNLTNKKINNLFNIKNKNNRILEINNIKKKLLLDINNILSSNYNEDDILKYLNKNIKEKFRYFIYKNSIRLDNRKYNEIRDINVIFNILPKTHSSCLFIKENTQSLITITLGNDNKNISLKNKNFIFHYNFLNYCFGEIGFLSFPKRREIGHGKLAYNSIFPIIPESNNFPYTIRLVSEIFESDGSSSMASVCGASLALMNLGISKEHIAGVAMGLIFIDNNEYIILSDITGEEDNYGDMDMKISGNCNYISALQMDVKICNNINVDLIRNVFFEAKKSIKNILEKMNYKISKPNKISKNLPIFKIIKIDVNYIKNIIGKGGNVIKKIINETNSEIDIDNDGTIKILSNNKEKLNLTLEKINNLLFIPKIGDIYFGKIIKKNNKGIILYIKKINKQFFVNYNIKNNNFNINEEVKVKIININNNKKIIFNILKNEK
ncbi:polyribonucleotide nucleotidyltransferase [Candidatus Nardonella dryophthoridicola]|uniref:Polyribonucleotide nucleotidyltransferase n=1 Tax=endosymbiont of Rhynchophorus ferrugineus TaxID=1972133 RepID=A0A2Z5T3L4_9GAMM|nr:polyribonucleotide nucleotidyltransferase [Candidatus Nardonella dryophthoridicola]QTJ62939.1 polyribonucleotide nucleotidyltransferase [Candidatus Nardonella dryophthoridicola]BBA84991.1 polyribonucleotide nucleotidyltransferase [endosymbiont of Rhynchophorus ferrugineus]